VAGNFFNILRLPYFRDGLLLFPSDSGFAFYLANPIFLLAAAVIVWGAVRRRLTGTDGFISVTLAVHFFALLMHKSFGGVQFGTRYLCDLVPALYYLVLRDPGRVPWKLSVPVMGWGIAFQHLRSDRVPALLSGTGLVFLTGKTHSASSAHKPPSFRSRRFCVGRS
jgi:hypothetical protein